MSSVNGPISFGTNTKLFLQQDSNGVNLPFSDFFFNNVLYSKLPTDFALKLFLFCQSYNL